MKWIKYIEAAAFSLFIFAFSANAKDLLQRTDEEITKEVEQKIKGNLYYDVFDWITVETNNGAVTLKGYVNDPWDKGFFEKIAGKVEGVKSVTDEIEKVNGPDELRYNAARAIYGNSLFWKYGFMKDPPIHIIVNNNNVILKGEVSSQVEKGWASMLIERDTNAFKVQNSLTVNKS
ncbi:MAG TPA: BON domain-containing protein [Ignavibacteriaceae bacterium]|nr:BON domain-containing protein [Ignavibacteriaceae bacterium]